jgi:hypothetical protein
MFLNSDMNLVTEAIRARTCDLHDGISGTLVVKVRDDLLLD